MRFSIKFIFLLCSIAFSGNCYSCSCGHLSVEEELKNSALVIRGIIISIDTIYTVDNYTMQEYRSNKKRIKNSLRNYLVLIKIFKQYKGSLTPDTLKIRTGHGGGDCGLRFIKNKEYIIYGNESKFNVVETITIHGRKRKRLVKDVPYYQTGICQRTTTEVIKEGNLIFEQLSKTN